MRVISANLQYGTPAAGEISTGNRWQQLAQLFSDYQADVICLQEVDFYQTRSGFKDQARSLADALIQVTGQSWRYRFLSFFAGQIISGIRLPATLPTDIPLNRYHPLRADRPLLGGYGVALLSPHPVHRWVSAKLGAAPLRINISGYNPRAWKFYFGQARSLLGAEILTPEGRFLVGSTHLELGTATAKRQLTRSWEGLASLAGKATPVLVGDMNLSREDAQQVYPHLTLASAPTFPSTEPYFQIDQVFAPATCQVLTTETILMPISDHRALFVDLQPLAGKQCAK